jgi:hypothetical protein
MKILFVLSFFGNFLLMSSLCGQAILQFDGQSEVLITQYSAIQQESKFRGFRVQLLSASGPQAKDEVNILKNQFQKDYPDFTAHLKWDAPNWKLRVGDFRNRLDALLFQRLIQSQYPQSYVVSDEVKMRSEKQ